MVEDDIGAQREIGEVGIIEAVDHRQAVVEDIGQADGGKGATLFARSCGAAVFDDAGFDRRFLDHRGEFEDVHVGHATIGVAIVEVASEEGELVFGCPGAGGVAAQFGGPFEDAAMRAAGSEIGHPDAGREAGRTFRAGGAVEDVLAAAEALFRQGVVQFLRMFPLQRGEQLPFHAPVEIGAGLRGRHVELGRYGKGVAHRAFLVGAGTTLARVMPVAKPGKRRESGALRGFCAKARAGPVRRQARLLIATEPRTMSVRPCPRRETSIRHTEMTCGRTKAMESE